MSGPISRLLVLAFTLAGCSAVASIPAASVPTASTVTAPSMETSPEPSARATASGVLTPAPTSVVRTPTPGSHVVTRVRIADLRIDLPVIAGDLAVYTPCGVALYLPELRQPGQGGAVYVYAHPREELFGPILDAVLAGDELVGLAVDVFTSDAFLYRYAIAEVRQHQRDINDALGVSTEQLWLQTGEGPPGTVDKIQLVALPDGTPTTVTERDAHPTPSPFVCP